jgi:hypothetical protein
MQVLSAKSIRDVVCRADPPESFFTRKPFRYQPRKIVIATPLESGISLLAMTENGQHSL